MRVTKYTADINPITNIQRPISKVAPEKSVKEIGSEKSLDHNRLKPIDLLSHDELSMLKQLFPTNENIHSEDMYYLDRKKVLLNNVGTLIDLKL